MLKWKLMLTTLPITIMVVILKYLISEQLQYEGLVKFSEIGLVITGGVFLIGFMLAGTMSDYKEGEKIPSEIACTIESIEDTITLAHGFKGGFELNPLRTQLYAITDSILQWLHRGTTVEAVFDKIRTLGTIALTLENAGAGAIASRVTSEQHNLRKMISRVNVIKRTHFLATGYAFLEVITVVVIGLLLVSKFDNLVISMIIVSFVTQIFLYMGRLIRDIDEPFDYSSKGLLGTAEIDLFPIHEYAQRAKARIEATAVSS